MGAELHICDAHQSEIVNLCSSKGPLKGLTRGIGGDLFNLLFFFKLEKHETRRGWCLRTGLRAAVNEYFCG